MIEVISLLQRANRSERRLLSQILDCSETEPRALAERLQRISSSLIAYRMAGQRLCYREIVDRVAKQIGIDHSHISTVQLERIICEQIWRSVWDKMTPAQQQQFERELIFTARSRSESKLVGLATLGGAMMLANASGFGVYMLASSALAAVTAGLGLALPFGTFMAVSSALSVVLGPVGFTGLGLLVLHRITGPKYQQMTIAVVAIASIRARLDLKRRPYPSWVTATAIAAGLLAAMTGAFWLRELRSRPSGTEPHKNSAAEAAEVSSIQTGAERPVSFGPHLFTVQPPEQDGLATLVISRDGRTVSSAQSKEFRVPTSLCGHSQWPNPGDFDGSGHLVIWVEEYSGGASCCAIWRLFGSERDHVREVLTVDNGAMFECPFTDLDGDGRPEIRILDSSFRYWRASTASSMMPVLVYRVRKLALEFAPDLMRNERPAHGDLEHWAAWVTWDKLDSAENPPTMFMAKLTELLERGAASSIRDFVRLAWPERLPGRVDFEREFFRRLRESPHWKEWEILNFGSRSVKVDAAPAFDAETNR